MDRRWGTQAQQRDAQEGFLEEGSPPQKLEEHTVQAGGGAPAGCREEVRCVQLLVSGSCGGPTPGEVSGVGGPMRGTEDLSVGRKAGQGVRKQSEAWPPAKVGGQLREPETQGERAEVGPKD